MRAVRVSADGFGPFRGVELEFAPRMTVVYGPNESGKSTWHAAVYAAICGMRRGRGAGKKEDREFRERYEPWDGSPWKVTGLIELDDGVRVAVTRDLANGVDQKVTDHATGRDVSNEFMDDGAPNLASAFGMDRRVFLATACIRQADVVGIVERAEELQEFVERAAATAGTDTTAARALAIIDDYHREHVGRDRRTSTKPLREAIVWVHEAKERLEAALEAHQAYVELQVEASEREAEASQLEAQVRAAEAFFRRKRVAELEEKLKRIRDLQARLPDEEPASLAEADDLGRTVTEAITAWKTRPEIPDLEGETSEELRNQLDALPPEPSGDLEVAAEVREAREALRRAAADLAAHERAKPLASADLSADLRGKVSPSEVRELARALQAPPPEAGPEEAEPAPVPGRRWFRPVVVGGGVGVVLGILGTSTGLTAAEAAMVGLVAGLMAVGLVAVLGRATAAQAPSAEEIAWRVRVQTAREEFERSLDRVSELGLPSEPSELFALADALDQSHDARRRLTEWEERDGDLRTRLHDARSRLAELLAARAVEVGDDVDAAFRRYEETCSARARQAIEAGVRSQLEKRLQDRVELETRATQIDASLGQIEASLRKVAAECGLDPTAKPDELVAGMQQWLEDRAERLEQAEADAKAWSELQTLLEGRTLEEWEAELEKAQQLAADDERVESLRVSEAELRQLRERARAARQQADELRGQVKDRGKAIDDPADAQDELEEAKRELERVRHLDELLSKARDFLASAAERVHRDVAPKLQARIETYLPTVTRGRHRRVRVDPDGLVVRVEDGEDYQPATRLSHGAMEQVYLLLRLAVVDLMVPEGKSCPILIDDFTVQSDSERTRAILDVLLDVSGRHQVIFFSQEDEVLAWAEAELDGTDGHSLIRL